MTTDQKIKQILSTYKKVTVIGFSSRMERPSYGVTNYLIENGFIIDAVNPNEIQTPNLPPIYKSILDIPHPLEIVDVFRASDSIPALIDELIPLHPKVIWLQEGVTNTLAEEKARQAGIEVISNRCILKEHKRLFST
ncbi:MAG: CoA-binding protein [Pseudobdellovibrio sp.]